MREIIDKSKDSLSENHPMQIRPVQWKKGEDRKSDDVRCYK